MKKFKITETKQQVAVDILTELKVWMMGLSGNSEPTKSEQDIIDIYNKMYKKYGLNNDPFTLMCCTDKEYQKNLVKYKKINDNGVELYEVDYE